jgi:hypothetical protein
MKDIYKHLPPIPPQVLLSIEPLFRFLREEELADTEHVIAHLSALISVPRKSIYRWLNDGITITHAEKIAAKMGLHPVYVWGPEYHIASYMEDNRQKFIENHRSRKAAVRRSIERANRNKESQNANP